MFTDDQSVHVADREIGPSGDQIAKTTGVQHRSRPEDVTWRRVDGACRGECHDVDGVGDEHDDGVG